MRSPLTCLRVLRGFLALALFILLPVLSLSCGGGGGGSTPDPVITAPAITTHPAQQTVAAGQPVSFTVVATGTSLGYQWRKDGVNVGGNSATLSIASAQASDAGSYTVVVSNTAGTVTSNAAVLTVNPAVVTPAITTQPAAQTVTAGQPASFTVVATGTSPSYQWKKDGANVGSNSATLTIASAQASDAGAYTVVVSNSAGSVTSNAAALTVNPVVVVPAITTQPVAQTVTEGQPASFSVVASGTAPLSYQWKKDGVNVGTNSASLTIASAQTTDAGSYSVVVSNSAGNAPSNAVTLTVNAASVTITAHPVNASAVVPDTATFTVTATGNSLSYQWKKDGVAIPGAISSTYTTPATSLDPTHPSGTYTFTVAVTSGGTTLTSNGAVLSVQQPDPTYAGDPVTVPTRVIPVWEYVTAYSIRGAFRLGYDEALMNPIWTSYCTYKVDYPSLEQGDRNYRADTRSSAAVGDGDFSNTGYTRGHQVLMSDMELRYGGQAGTDSCYTTNLVPQKDTHNTNIWNSFEQEVSGAYNVGTKVWTKSGMVAATNRMWISTGPTFAATPARTTPGKGMAIPNGFWKVMVKEVGGVPKALAVLTPHEPVPPTADLWKYVTTIQRIETLTGLNLFPNLPTNAPADFKTAADVRGWGSVFENTSGPNAHILLPEWDTTVVAGNSVTFTGYGTSAGTVASATWTFSDGQATTASNTVTRAFASAGTYTATYTVVDGAAGSKAISRTVVVTGGNAAPVISTLTDQSTTPGTAKVVNFTVTDDADISLTGVTVSSNNQTLLPDANCVLVNTAGNCVLTLTPTAALTGSAVVTLTATDGNGASTQKTFTLFVANTGGTGTVIISQYYEGTSNNKWIELTNVGTGSVDLASPQLYLVLYANPTAATNFATQVPTGTLALTGTLGAGQSILVRASAAVGPSYAMSASPQISSGSVCGFNGNDPIVLSTSGATGTAWSQRLDMVGLTDGTNWGVDLSLIRKTGIATPNPTYTASEWTSVPYATVDGAAAGSTERLGFHQP